jgi:hypothetical protein
METVNYGRNKFYDTGPREPLLKGRLGTGDLFFKIGLFCENEKYSFNMKNS